jgi:hypothetical protein
MSQQKRANRLVRELAEQLAPYAPNNLPTLIMPTSTRQKGIGLDKHTLGRLFGELQMHLQVNPQTGRTVSEAGFESMMGVLSPAAETAT